MENNSTSQIVKFKLNRVLCMELDGQCIAALRERERERERVRANESGAENKEPY